MNKNITEVKALSYAIALINGDTSAFTEFSEKEYADKLATMLDNRIKKSSKSGISTAEAEKRSELAEIIISALATTETPVTISELQRMTPELQTYKGEIISTQKIVSVIKPLVNDGVVTNIKDKKKSLFSLTR